MRRYTIRAVLGIAMCLAAGGVQAGDADAEASPPSPPAPGAIEELQRQIDVLSRQLQALQDQLETLRLAQERQQRQAEVQVLRQAAAAAAATATSVATEEIDTTTSFVSGTRMQPQLNPEISVTGDIFFVGGNHQQEEWQASHFELDIQSYLDPYTRMHLVLGWHVHGHEATFGAIDDESEHGHEGGVHVEEAFVTWLNLPGSSSLTIGKKRQQFGTLNRWHLHAFDQVDAPLVLTESFGEEGLSGTGVSFDWLMPRMWAGANELIVEVMNGDNDVAFAGEDWEHPTVLARLKSYWDLSADRYLELGLNGLHGKADGNGNLSHDFYAVDLTYNWSPTGREHYRELTLRGMLLRSELEIDREQRCDAWGGYVYGQYRLSPHWIAGVRYDRVDDQRDARHHYWGISPYLTFWQSEFVRLRGQASYLEDSRYGIDRRFTLQLTFAAGPHKHESY